MEYVERRYRSRMGRDAVVFTVSHRESDLWVAVDRGDAADEALDDERRAWALQNRYRLLSQMEGYCNTTGCLREYMLRYFGDEAAAARNVSCTNCAGGSTVTSTATPPTCAPSFPVCRDPTPRRCCMKWPWRPLRQASAR